MISKCELVINGYNPRLASDEEPDSINTCIILVKTSHEHLRDLIWPLCDDRDGRDEVAVS
jgi:hypothetical protein